MGFNHKWMTMLLNSMLGGGYIALILAMIQWVSTGKLGIKAIFVPIGLLVFLTLAWTLLDRKKHGPAQPQLIKQIEG